MNIRTDASTSSFTHTRSTADGNITVSTNKFTSAISNTGIGRYNNAADGIITQQPQEPNILQEPLQMVYWAATLQPVQTKL
jgi:hypothetical protein